MAPSSKAVTLLLVLVACWHHGISAQGQGQPVSTWVLPFPASKFNDNLQCRWNELNAVALNGGNQLQLSLTNQTGGTSVSSRATFFYGFFQVGIKLPQGDTAGTCTTFYIYSSVGDGSGVDRHSEVDLEFLGNRTGQPYILQTNIFANGTGNREQRVTLDWFDPTADFTYYSIIWNHRTISIYVGDQLIRAFQNNNAQGQAFPNKEGMQVYASIFDASSWATRGGLDKLAVTHPPINVLYRDFNFMGCAVNDPVHPNEPCTLPSATDWWNAPEFQTLSAARIAQMKALNAMHMVYDYCTDYKRFPVMPYECTVPLH